MDGYTTTRVSLILLSYFIYEVSARSNEGEYGDVTSG